MRLYKLLLLKAYFERGLGVTSPIKYLIALLGAYSYIQKLNFGLTVIIGISYLISCFLVGYLWFKFELVNTENEIQNRFNPFQREVRNHLKNKKFK